MNEMELTDLHNRRANIITVSNLAKAHGYPLLAWPEDKQLLRLADLPRLVQANKPINWTHLEPGIYFIVANDQALRDIIKPGKAYAINPALGQFNGSYVQEYKVTTR
jgi:hypothetical protein